MNTQYYPPSYPPLATAPQAQGPSTTSGGFPTNAQPYQTNHPGIQSFVPPPPRSNPPVQGHSANGIRFPTNAQYYSGPPVASTIGQNYITNQPTGPPVQAPPTSSTGFPTNTQIYSRQISSSRDKVKFGAPPVQVPSSNTSGGGLVTKNLSREPHPLGPSVDIKLNPRLPTDTASCQTPAAASGIHSRHHQHHNHHLSTDTQQPPTAKAPQPKKPKSSGKHPHTEPRMCEKETRTFVGCPCTITILKSCKGGGLAVKDASTLTKCEAFQEVTGSKTGNCKGKGDHWACPAMIKFWSEKQIESDDGSLIWV